jgi:hypothetical protein
LIDLWIDDLYIPHLGLILLVSTHSGSMLDFSSASRLLLRNKVFQESDCGIPWGRSTDIDHILIKRRGLDLANKHSRRKVHSQWFEFWEELGFLISNDQSSRTQLMGSTFPQGLARAFVVT